MNDERKIEVGDGAGACAHGGAPDDRGAREPCVEQASLAPREPGEAESRRLGKCPGEGTLTEGEDSTGPQGRVWRARGALTEGEVRRPRPVRRHYLL